MTRLARNCSDWYPLLDVCGHRGCLIADRDGIYDPGTPNGRLLLGLKGTISELELHTIRGRLTAGLLAKAERGELAQPLPAGFVRDPSGVVTKDPDREVQDRVNLVFESFLSLRTAVRVMRSLHAGNLSLPRRDRHGEVCWKRPTIPAVTDMLKNPDAASTTWLDAFPLENPVDPEAFQTSLLDHTHFTACSAPNRCLQLPDKIQQPGRMPCLDGAL